jgi:hypothetical protein
VTTIFPEHLKKSRHKKTQPGQDNPAESIMPFFCLSGTAMAESTGRRMKSD